MSSPIQRPDSAESSTHSREPEKAPEARGETHDPALPFPVLDDRVTIVPTDLDQLERDIAEAAKQARPAAGPGAPLAREVFRLSRADLDQLEREIAAEQARLAHTLERKIRPEPLPPPPPLVRRRHDVAMITRSAVVIALVSLAVPAALGAFPRLGELKSAAVEQWSKFAASTRETMAHAVAPLTRPAEPPPRLVVEDSTAAADGDATLGIKIDRHREGAVVILSDYAPGTAFSVGDAWGDASWLIPVAELGEARVRPPDGFAGMMQLGAALRLIDGSLADRQSIRIDWPAAAPIAQPNTPAPRRLGADEIALLLQRGQELLEHGDIASARLILRRAAEAEDARAAYALAATYDPNVLRELRVYGSAPDAAKARAWYEKAIAFGSREAPQRLELLVSESR